MILVTIQGFTAVAAIAAFVIAILALQSSLTSIQTGRERAAVDSCYLLRGVLYTATPRTPQAIARANEFVAKTALSNCDGYGRRIRKGQVR
jgi:hypothetical protein